MCILCVWTLVVWLKWMDGWMDSIKSWWVNQLTHLGRWKWGTGKYRTKKAHNAWPVRCTLRPNTVSAICRSGYFQLRQLRPVARSLTADAAKTIVHAFVACRLDYCNSLLHGITDSLFRRLQSVQNAAARLITGTRRRDHITPVLRDLHRLPVSQNKVSPKKYPGDGL